jgi:alpha-beta hydrolase superfamily lysophospholipase
MKKNNFSRLIFVFTLLISLSGWASERITFKAVDGTKLSGLMFRAAHPKALLLVVHGLQSHADWFLSGPTLAANGITSLAYDRRGSGHSGGNRGDASSADEMLSDLNVAYKTLKKENPELEIHVLANCFGTRLVVPYIVQHPHAFDSLILTSPATNMTFSADFNLFEKLEIKSASKHHPMKYFKTPLKDSLFITSKEGLNWIANDKLSLREATARFYAASNVLTGIMNKNVKKLKIPLLLILADKDDVVYNSGIKNEIFGHYSGKIDIVELNSEHFMEMSTDVKRYRSELVDWIVGN